MKIKLDKADLMFSKYIRTRDRWTCVRCGNNLESNPQGLHCSHYFGRRKEGTRFDPDNCDSLCYGCHRHWESTDREAYRTYKINQLGEDGFNLLQLKANSYCKKDRKMSYIIVKAMYEELNASIRV